MGPGDFASSGHYIVISGYNENGFTVLDPNNKSNTAKTWKYTTIESQIKSMWSLSN
jgi:predicted double-glycine peptidase